MTNPFTTVANRATTVETLPPSLPALFVLVIVGIIDVVALVLYGVLTYQEKGTGNLDLIITTSTAGLLGCLAKLQSTQAAPTAAPPDPSQPPEYRGPLP